MSDCYVKLDFTFNYNTKKKLDYKKLFSYLSTTIFEIITKKIIINLTIDEIVQMKNTNENNICVITKMFIYSNSPQNQKSRSHNVNIIVKIKSIFNYEIDKCVFEKVFNLVFQNYELDYHFGAKNEYHNIKKLRDDNIIDNINAHKYVIKQKKILERVNEMLK